MFGGQQQQQQQQQLNTTTSGGGLFGNKPATGGGLFGGSSTTANTGSTTFDQIKEQLVDYLVINNQILPEVFLEILSNNKRNSNSNSLRDYFLPIPQTMPNHRLVGVNHHNHQIQQLLMAILIKFQI